MTNEDLIDRQLEAYNRLDIEDLLSTYAPDIEFRDFETGRVLLKGHRQVRSHHLGKLFNPDLCAEIIGRLSIGNFVFDHEIVKGLRMNEIVEAICVYKCSSEMIEKIWVKNISCRSLEL